VFLVFIFSWRAYGRTKGVISLLVYRVEHVKAMQYDWILVQNNSHIIIIIIIIIIMGINKAHKLK